MKWTREQLILSFLRLQENLGHQPSRKEWREGSNTPSDMPIRQNFGSWSKMLKELEMKPLKYIPSLNGHTRKGTRNKERFEIVTKHGYVHVFEPTHPVSNKKGYCLKHRMIAWDNGMLKNLEDIVHHKDKNKLNNKIENLEVMTRGKHTTLHTKGELRPRNNSVKCLVNGCNIMVKGKYGLCRKHYKLAWQRKRDGLIDNIHEEPKA